MKNGLDDNFRFLENTLSVRTYRQQLLAANITNGDTPNYKAVDVDFDKAMRRAQAGRSGDVNMTRTESGHLPGLNTQTLARETLFRRDSQVGIDGNSVNLDDEQASFSENAIQYQAAVNFLSGKIKTLLTAIQGS